MTYIVVQTNIAAIQAWITFVGLGVLICLEGFGSALHAAIARKIPFERFRNEECGWLFWCAWLLACFLFSLLGSLFVWDMYSVSYQSDAAPLIFGALLFYIVAIRGWIWVNYTMRWNPLITYVLSAMAIVAALFVLGLAFLTIDDHPWHHYFTLVLLIPPVLVMVSTYKWNRSVGTVTTAASYTSSTTHTTSSTHRVQPISLKMQPKANANSMMAPRQSTNSSQTYDLSNQPVVIEEDAFPV